MPDASESLIETIRRSLIGDQAALEGPFGKRRLVYADYAASGRALSFIEDYLRDQVLPFYGNTHTEASATGRHTTRLREEARRAVHACTGGGPDDVVLFCGSGSTGAIDKLLGVLGLRIPAELDGRYRLSSAIPLADRPVVFIGPHEHHSNELPWRESLATVVPIPEDGNGGIDLAALERALSEHARRPLKIGSFSAGSNVTGALADTLAVTALLHRHGALSFWDYAAAGPYLPIEMNPHQPGVPSDLLSKDAVFLSPHKFVGGPGASGVLVAKRRLFTNRVPTVPGGGTISYVNSGVHHYIDDVVAREEGGTPNILGAIRAGLVFRLKQAVGSAAIGERERAFTSRAIGSWQTNPNIVVLGETRAPRLPIVSLLIRHGQRFLHHNFVVSLLNDLFGIQVRGGCSCAGPYGHALLGIGQETSHGFEEQVLSGRLGIKPGWVRLSFGYFFDDETLDYLARAVHIVASHGFRLLSHYEFDPGTGAWSHQKACPPPVFRIADALLERPREASPPPSSVSLGDRLEEVLRLIEHSGDTRPPLARPALPESFERLRWFSLPADLGARRPPHTLHAFAAERG
jgi:selenocysteine lyase/cysteine desulfurase